MMGNHSKCFRCGELDEFCVCKQQSSDAAAKTEQAPMKRVGWFIQEGGAWVATSSDDPRATILYRAEATAAGAGSELSGKTGELAGAGSPEVDPSQVQSIADRIRGHAWETGRAAGAGSAQPLSETSLQSLCGASGAESALAATQGKRRWWPARDGDHDYAQIAAGPEHIAQVRILSVTEADLNLIVATDPISVLELIAEVERLRSAPAAGTVKDTELADVLNTTLWLYRRLPHTYGKPPFVDRAILTMAKRLGLDDVPEAIKERAAIEAHNRAGK